MTTRRCTLAIGLVVTVGSAPALAQERTPPWVYAGVRFEVGQATGQFADYVDFGGGGGGFVEFRPAGGPLGVRLAATYLIYGSQTHRYPLVPGITVDVTTRNQIAQIALGPQITLGRGIVGVYGFGAIGGSFFWTNSSVEGSGTNQPFASTTNYHDATFAGEIGSGLQVRLANARVPVFLDLGLRYVDNGRVTYVTKDRVSIVGNQLVVDPVDSDANLLVYHLGVTVGLPPGRR